MKRLVLAKAFYINLRKLRMIGLKINNKESIGVYFFTQNQTFPGLDRNLYTLQVFIAMQEATYSFETHTSCNYLTIR